MSIAQFDEAVIPRQQLTLFDSASERLQMPEHD
jgi:hypothetical protein